MSPVIIYTKVVRAALPASLALVVHSYGPLLHEQAILKCPDSDPVIGDLISERAAEHISKIRPVKASW